MHTDEVQADVVPMSLSKRYTVLPWESTRIWPYLAFIATLMVAFAAAGADALDVLELDVVVVLDEVEVVAVSESDEHAAVKKPVETRIKASTRRMLPSSGFRRMVRMAGREGLRRVSSTVTCP